jgi:23S rRNA pseudouridine1911/1915/1917 synthase
MSSSGTGETLATTVAEPSRLDRALALAFPQESRARFQRLIAEGCVAVEGKIATDPGLKVKPGMQLIVHMPEAKAPEPEAEDLPLTIVFEDRDVIVIDKPAGLVVHPGAGNDSGTLVNALIAHCGDSLSGIGGVKRPGIVHRLDKDTSGLLVVAKNDAAHRALSEQFAAHGRDGRLERSYLALVWGVPERKSGVISAALARSTANRQKIAVSRSASARQAVTHYDVLEDFAGRASLIRCVLETGRTHQIRVHMAHLGHPLLGDATYGAGFRASLATVPKAAQEAVAALPGQALHAATLGFEHPRSGKPLHFAAAPPAAFARLLTTLRSISG